LPDGTEARSICFIDFNFVLYLMLVEVKVEGLPLHIATGKYNRVIAMEREIFGKLQGPLNSWVTIGREIEGNQKYILREMHEI